MTLQAMLCEYKGVKIICVHAGPILFMLLFTVVAFVLIFFFFLIYEILWTYVKLLQRCKMFMYQLMAVNNGNF